MIRPATCEGGGEARRSRWVKADQHSVINNKEEKDKVNKEEDKVNKEEDKEDKEEREYPGSSSKFEAALKDLEALGRGQGTRYSLNFTRCLGQF